MTATTKTAALDRERNSLISLRGKQAALSERVKRCEQAIARLEFEAKIEDYNAFSAALSAAGLSIGDIIEAVSRGDYEMLAQKATNSMNEAANSMNGNLDAESENDNDNEEGTNDD